MSALRADLREAGRIAAHYGPRLACRAAKAAAEIAVAITVVALPAALIIATVPS